MKQDITNISIHFQGTSKGKRKIAFQSERVAQIDGHLTFTPDDFNRYERNAKALIVDRGYKNVTKASLCVNHGYNDGDITMVQLLPKQRQLVVL